MLHKIYKEFTHFQKFIFIPKKIIYLIKKKIRISEVNMFIFSNLKLLHQNHQ
jgi:hypothetical protein